MTFKNKHQITFHFIKIESNKDVKWIVINDWISVHPESERSIQNEEPKEKCLQKVSSYEENFYVCIICSDLRPEACIWNHWLLGSLEILFWLNITSSHFSSSVRWGGVKNIFTGMPLFPHLVLQQKKDQVKSKGHHHYVYCEAQFAKFGWIHSYWKCTLTKVFIFTKRVN